MGYLQCPLHHVLPLLGILQSADDHFCVQNRILKLACLFVYDLCICLSFLSSNQNIGFRRAEVLSMSVSLVPGIGPGMLESINICVLHK